MQMSKRPHPRLEEMVAEYSWVRGIDTESGRAATGTDVRGGVDGREATLFCWYPDSSPMWWSAGVFWSDQMGRRDRKRVSKQGEEILSQLSGPELQRTQQEYQLRSADTPVKHQRKYGGGLKIAKTGVYFTALGEPLPALEIMTLLRNLAALADQIEAHQAASHT